MRSIVSYVFGFVKRACAHIPELSNEIFRSLPSEEVIGGDVELFAEKDDLGVVELDLARLILRIVGLILPEHRGDLLPREHLCLAVLFPFFSYDFRYLHIFTSSELSALITAAYAHFEKSIDSGQIKMPTA